MVEDTSAGGFVCCGNFIPFLKSLSCESKGQRSKRLWRCIQFSQLMMNSWLGPSYKQLPLIQIISNLIDCSSGLKRWEFVCLRLIEGIAINQDQSQLFMIWGQIFPFSVQSKRESHPERYVTAFQIYVWWIRTLEIYNSYSFIFALIRFSWSFLWSIYLIFLLFWKPT